jgi:hypothetical protein
VVEVVVLVRLEFVAELDVEQLFVVEVVAVVEVEAVAEVEESEEQQNVLVGSTQLVEIVVEVVVVAEVELEPFGEQGLQ